MTTPVTSTSVVAPKTPAPKTPAKKPVSKEATAKKPVTKKGAPSEIFAKWKAGAPIHELVKTFKLSRPQVRRQLLLGAGSREAFKALRKQGAGGTPGTKGKKDVLK